MRITVKQLLESKHTGEEKDICYVDLNGIKTTCGQWEENKD